MRATRAQTSGRGDQGESLSHKQHVHGALLDHRVEAGAVKGQLQHVRHLPGQLPHPLRPGMPVCAGAAPNAAEYTQNEAGDATMLE